MKFRVNDLKFNVVCLEGRAGKAKRFESLSIEERHFAYFAIAFVLSNGESTSSVWLDFQKFPHFVKILELFKNLTKKTAPTRQNIYSKGI